MQVDLREASEEHAADVFGRTRLPDDGIVSLYHDLETFGWERSDNVGAWAVVWRPLAVAEEPDLVLVSEEEGEAPFFPINPQVMATAPSPLDMADLDEAEWARYDRAVNWLEQSAPEMNLLATTSQDLATP